jgi:hypothetical protein
MNEIKRNLFTCFAKEGIWGKRSCLLLLIAFALMSLLGYPQNPNATVRGLITDPSGAVIPGATVEFTNTATGVVAKTVSNDAGAYNLMGLIPGTYRANVSMQGFKAVVRDNVVIHVGDVLSLNFPLEIGAQTEVVEVSSQAPLIDSVSTSLANVIEGRQVEDIPLNGRNAMNLIAMVPGVVAQGATAGSTVSNQSLTATSSIGFGNYRIGGGIAGMNATYWDGATLNGLGYGQTLVPTQDAVGEFRVETSAAGAQYGRFAGGVVNFSSKSGTNQYHGSAYEYLRNTVFNANTWTNNLNGLPRDFWNQNQYGATFGGPIKKDKTFFFGSWESLRIAARQNYAQYVPTDAEMSGDFRQSPYTLIYGKTTDPLTGLQVQCNGVLNVICPNKIDSTATAMYNYGYFKKADPALVAQMVNNPTPGNNPKSPVDIKGFKKFFNKSDQVIGRLDHRINDKQNLFFRYTWWQLDVPWQTGDIPLPKFPDVANGFTTNQYVAGYNYTFSPTLTADVRGSYTRYYSYAAPVGSGTTDLSFLGPNWAIIQQQLPYKALPGIFMQPSWTNMPKGLNRYSTTYNNIYGLSFSLTKLLGKHTLSFGGELRRVENYTTGNSMPGGHFSFQATATGNNPLANFVMGIPTISQSSQNQIQISSRPAARYLYMGYYFTDSYRITPKLTLNYGLRLEVPGAWTSHRDEGVVLLPDAVNPLQSYLGTFVNPVTGKTQSLEGILAALNSTEYPETSRPGNHYLFQPRIGISYSPVQSTVVRAAFGISAPSLEWSAPAGTTSPFTTAVTLGAASLSNPYPNGLNLPLQRSTESMNPYPQFPRTLLGTDISGQVPSGAYPYVMQWNFNVERAITSSMSLLASYVGARGVHLGPMDANLNQIPAWAIAQYGSQLTTKVTNPFYGLVSPTSGRLGGRTINLGQLLVPYPEFGQFTSTNSFMGDSIYHAMVLNFKKRFGSGGTVNAAYTWSKNISTIDTPNGGLDPGFAINNGGIMPQDYTNLAGERSLSAADIPQRLVINYVLDLPFGKGKRYYSNPNSVMNVLVSGWTFSGILEFQDGIPLAFKVFNGNTLSQQFNAGRIRPNVIANCDKTSSGSYQDHIANGTPVFNTACFTSPGNYAFGNEGRTDNVLRMQGVNNIDLDLGKNFRITERFNVEFHAQLFNIVNHVRFDVPDQQFGSTTFGMVNLSPTGSGGGQYNKPRTAQFSLRLLF